MKDNNRDSSVKKTSCRVRKACPHCGSFAVQRRVTMKQYFCMSCETYFKIPLIRPISFDYVGVGPSSRLKRV